MTYIPDRLRKLVYERAGGQCEYCLLHNEDAFPSHEIDHIFAEKHGGTTIESNLCLSCFDCNRHKGSDIASIDFQTNELTLLFDPRRDQWVNNFTLLGAEIQPLTSTGRVTVRLLQINSYERLDERKILSKAGRYPHHLPNT